MNISKKRLHSLLDRAMWSAYGVNHRENVQEQHDISQKSNNQKRKK